MIESITKVAGIISSIMVIITFIGLLCKPIRTRIFAKLSADKSERAGICALLRKEIISECKKAINQGSIYFYDLENLDDMFTQYQNLGGNHNIETLFNQAKALPVNMED